jgi:hypothetical protein
MATFCVKAIGSRFQICDLRLAIEKADPRSAATPGFEIINRKSQIANQVWIMSIETSAAGP